MIITNHFTLICVEEIDKISENMILDCVDSLLQAQQSNTITVNSINTFFAIACQKSLLSLANMNKIKKQYGEKYFDLMDISHQNFLQESFDQQTKFDYTPGSLKRWLKASTLRTTVLKLPFYPNFTDDKVISIYGEKIKNQK